MNLQDYFTGRAMETTNHIQKLEALIDHYRYSTKLAEALGVSRISIINWRGGANISKENRVKIDYLYYEKIFVPKIEERKQEIESYIKQVTSKDYSNIVSSTELVEEVAKFNSFGSLEIETSIDQKEFESIIEGDYIEQDIQKRKVLESNNLYHLTKKIIKDTLKGNIELSVSLIKEWHFALFLGIREDAGEFSKRVRKIKDVDLTLTHPKDIEEEMEYWINLYQKPTNIYDVAKAHEHFELIHPFSDGNGRIGRLIMAHQAIRLKLLPPYIHQGNKALYYACLLRAQKQGNILPLSWFLCKAIEEMEGKLGQV